MKGRDSVRDVTEAFIQSKVIAIIRHVPVEKLPSLLDALHRGGICMAEITLNSPDALRGISMARERMEGRMFIGAGTVLNRREASAAYAAGAAFVVSPNIDRTVIEFCMEKRLLSFPGALTPTEVVSAMAWGSMFVKLFPASTFGPGYIRELMGPLSDARLVAVGGIGKENAREYIENGAMGVGVGGKLCDLRRIEENRFDEIEEEARELINTVGSAYAGERNAGIV